MMTTASMSDDRTFLCIPPGLKSSTTISIFALEVQTNNAGCNVGFTLTQAHFEFKRKIVFN